MMAETSSFVSAFFIDSHVKIACKDLAEQSSMSMIKMKEQFAELHEQLTRDRMLQ
jgi:hypothetical protein